MNLETIGLKKTVKTSEAGEDAEKLDHLLGRYATLFLKTFCQLFKTFHMQPPYTT